MPVQNFLQLQREQILAIARGDVDAAHQIERLLAISNLSGFGQSVVSDDIVLDATGATLSVILPVGRYFVDLVIMATVGGGAGGFTIEDASDATLSAGAYAVMSGDVVATLAFPAPRPGPYAAVPTTGVTFLRGFVDVQKTGALGFKIVQAGAPTSTLLAGSGLTTTVQRGSV